VVKRQGRGGGPYKSAAATPTGGFAQRVELRNPPSLQCNKKRWGVNSIQALLMKNRQQDCPKAQYCCVAQMPDVIILRHSTISATFERDTALLNR
jgi:hypothetical protein